MTRGERLTAGEAAHEPQRLAREQRAVGDAEPGEAGHDAPQHQRDHREAVHASTRRNPMLSASASSTILLTFLLLVLLADALSMGFRRVLA